LGRCARRAVPSACDGYGVETLKHRNDDRGGSSDMAAQNWAAGSARAAVLQIMSTEKADILASIFWTLWSLAPINKLAYFVRPRITEPITAPAPASSTRSTVLGKYG
jgi:hypothetical protein